MNSAERRESRRTLKYGPKRKIVTFFTKDSVTTLCLSCGHEVPAQAPRANIDANPFVRCGLCPKPETC